MLVRLILGSRVDRPPPDETLDGVTFTARPVDTCDGVLIVNHARENTRLVCPPENVWVVVMEPFVAGMTEWILHPPDAAARIYSHHPVPDRRWHRAHVPTSISVGRSRAELLSMPVPVKSHGVSTIMATTANLPGHRRRLDFLEALGDLPIDRFGRHYRYVEDKWDAIAPYRAKIAIENAVSPDYVTEKLPETLLGWTVPLYAGCPNITDYYPAEAFVPIDLDDVATAREVVREAATPAFYARRLDAIAHARRLFLERYEFYAFFGRAFGAAGPRPRSVVDIRRFRVADQPVPQRVRMRVMARINHYRRLLWMARRWAMGKPPLA